MSPDKWQRVVEIFEQALTLPENDRAPWIADVCAGDVELQRELDGMLKAHNAAGTFLESPPADNIAALVGKEIAPELNVGQIVAHYRIISRLGVGGMGEVYLAEDTKLSRKVALKILPSSMTSDPDRLRRFQQEGRAASALNHPNILTIHEVGQVDSIPYLATEFIAGETLRQRLAAPIDIREAIDIAMQVASALTAAHHAGIVHRDIKPENLMLRADGYVKVLDFGLAKPVQKPVTLDLEEATRALVRTGRGVVMGTVNYMSPEQARATATDERTDIWSLGVVLYEMLTGRAPFAGDTRSDVIAAVLRAEPQRLSDVTADVPVEIERIVGKALTKDREERYQTAKDLLADLRRVKRQLETHDTASDRSMSPESAAETKVSLAAVSTASVTPVHASSAEYIITGIKQHKLAIVLVLAAIGAGIIGLAFYLPPRATEAAIESIAVLPFENQSNNQDADYISDGIAESINNALTRVPNLKVIPYSVTLHYKGKGLNVNKIGTELNVNALLTGRVVQRGDNVTIFVELDDMRNGKQIWGEQYNRKLSDLLAMQTEIAAETSRRLRSQLTGAEKQQLTKGSTQNPEAYQAYLKGNFYVSRYTKDGMKKAIEQYKQAIVLDSNYALAYTGLSYAYWNSAGWYLPSSEAATKAREPANRALAIDDSLSDAHLGLAAIAHWYDWDWATANKEFKRAIELNTQNQRNHGFYSWFLAGHGRSDLAIQEGKQSVQLDPVSPEPYAFLGMTYFLLRQYDQAVDQLRNGIEIDPSFWMLHDFLGRAYEAQGKWPEAIAEFKRALELEHENGENLANLAHAYAMSGKKEEAQNILDQLKQTSRTYVEPYFIASVYAALGDNDQSFDWLKRAFNERSFGPAFYVNSDAQFDKLRSDPRYDELYKRLGLTQ